MVDNKGLICFYKKKINYVQKDPTDMGDELCEFCPLTSIGKVNTNQYNLCEGSRCNDAYQNYLEEENYKLWLTTKVS